MEHACFIKTAATIDPSHRRTPECPSHESTAHITCPYISAAAAAILPRPLDYTTGRPVGSTDARIVVFQDQPVGHPHLRAPRDRFEGWLQSLMLPRCAVVCQACSGNAGALLTLGVGRYDPWLLFVTRRNVRSERSRLGRRRVSSIGLVVGPLISLAPSSLPRNWGKEDTPPPHPPKGRSCSSTYGTI